MGWDVSSAELCITELVQMCVCAAIHLFFWFSVCSGYCLLQPGYCVVRAGKAVGSGVGAGAQRLVSLLLWMFVTAPGW